MALMKFTIRRRDRATSARSGEIETRHGIFRTPAFMPVGTKAAVRALYPSQLREAGVEILLSNAYHLRLRPGDDYIQARGGLHRFMGWDGPILTDSGGYQIFSLAHRRRLSEDGVEFASPIDGATEFFTPERVLDIQRNLGSDIVMPLDHPAPGDADREEANRALQQTLNWWDRSRRHWGSPADQALFAIVQGGCFEELRSECVNRMIDSDPPGFSIGGLSVGEPKERLHGITEFTARLLPPEKPRYLMGVGTPADIVRAVAAGVDMFDCILPTRLGRTGWAFVPGGKLKIRNAEFKEDDRPLDESCGCPACRSFSRAAIRHYFNVGEILGPASLSIHNVHVYQSLMRRIRDAIAAGTFEEMVRHADDQ
jgi:queuine tRNA-ribosyltransferase